nr:hypothetical protein [uncultured Desulfobulbus sp.]
MAGTEKTKFIDQPFEEQSAEVHKRFEYRGDSGWYTAKGEFAGANEKDVIAALIDFEEAEINSIGDCMGGICVIQPKFEDFVRKPFRRYE